MHKAINLSEQFDRFTDTWSAKIAGKLTGTMLPFRLQRYELNGVTDDNRRLIPRL